MSVSALAIIEAALMIFGGMGAARFTSRIAKRIDRKMVLMASVTVWFILFAMIPFGIFAILSGRVAPQKGGVDPLSNFVLNAIPFALIAAPLIGFAQGWALSTTKPSE
ncbi:MAG TPA: hypothetical protein VNA87_05490 [Actinomycetota bacterium]|nr:hypothetical protein [Actinomycetota bacterium]